MLIMKKRLDGNAIRLLRKQKGLTLRELQDIADVDYRTISEIERGIRPSKENAYKLSKALEFSPLEWTWILPNVAENLKAIGVEDEDDIILFLTQLEADEWSDIERW